MRGHSDALFINYYQNQIYILIFVNYYLFIIIFISMIFLFTKENISENVYWILINTASLSTMELWIATLL